MISIYALSLFFSFSTHNDLYSISHDQEGSAKWSLNKAVIILVISTILIAIGSSLQIILFVAPILIFLSLMFTPMSIIFNEFELIALIASVLIANRVSHDGESNWLEGIQLLSVYLIIAASSFIL